MQPVGEHAVPAGPLAVRWVAHEVPPLRAGAVQSARLLFENAGEATWPPLYVSYHFLDDLDNHLVWDSHRTAVPPLEPDDRIELQAWIRAPMPPASYRIAFDLVVEQRYWFEELGNVPLITDVEVVPRIGRALAVRGSVPEGQEEPLVPEREAEAIAFVPEGVELAPDWSRRVLDAHQQGYGVVGLSLDAGRSRAFRPWAPTGAGRDPAFPHPLLCPSVVRGTEVDWQPAIDGVPLARPRGDEPWLYDQRITARLRSDRRRA